MLGSSRVGLTAVETRFRIAGSDLKPADRPILSRDPTSLNLWYQTAGDWEEVDPFLPQTD